MKQKNARTIDDWISDITGDLQAQAEEEAPEPQEQQPSSKRANTPRRTHTPRRWAAPERAQKATFIAKTMKKISRFFLPEFGRR